MTVDKHLVVQGTTPSTTASGVRAACCASRPRGSNDEIAAGVFGSNDEIAAGVLAPSRPA